ncbi:tax1-binding protein 1 homolog B-like isoform X4 [Mytilus trossulus]|uniref:tax1-binding protein 1 homolog B-like isoform X4 n=1 Tax=Mytilus trossulus TaxID=6551 RepID=UPI00300495EC
MRFGMDDEPDVDKNDQKNMEEVNTEEEAAASSTGETTNKRKEFAMVIFHNIPETYPADAHIECGYTLTSDLTPSRSDWIGLYKVGWLSTRDYIYYDWVNIPSSYEAGKDAEGHILFPSHKLPNDDGEFYQFCYVTSSGQIRGASTPFQFRRPSADDFLEIEDEETEMLVIRSKTVVMEENISKLESEKTALLQMQHDLELERDELVNKLYSLDQNLQEVLQQNKHLSDQVNVDKQTIGQLQQEAKDLIMVRDEVQQKADTVKRDRETIQDKVSRLDEEIYKLKEFVKRLQNEKDNLEGENLKLKQGIDMYKQHFTKQEGTDKESARQIEDLEIKLAKQESLVEHLKSNLDSTKAELEQTQLLLHRQGEILSSDKENIDYLSEKIQNLEDKLAAADNVKELLQEELKTFTEHNHKMANDLQMCKEENHTLKQKLSQDQDVLGLQVYNLQIQLKEKAAEIEAIHDQVEEKEKNLAYVQLQVEKLRTDNSELGNKLEKASETSIEGSMQCLVIAQSTLKDRYSKMEHHLSQYQTDSAKKQKEYKQEIKDMKREIEDLKERLTMGSNEYRNLYIENRKLTKKMEKLEKRKPSRQSSETDVITIEQYQMTSPDMSAAENVIENQLQSDLDDVGKELDLRQEQKLKYKISLIEERKRAEKLKKELKEKDDEIEMLKKSLIEIQNEKDVKVRSLENYMADKDKTIDELNRKIRDSINLHDNFILPPQYKRRAEEGQSAAASPPVPPPRTDLKKTPTQEDVNPEVKALDPPLRPLPPPMIPERLQTSKTAEVVHLICGAEGGNSIPSAPPMQDMKEERFVDAPGEGMKICPVCSSTFSADVSDANFEEHVIGHVGRICPLCYNIVENCTDEEFQRHVNQHLDSKNSCDIPDPKEPIEFD